MAFTSGLFVTCAAPDCDSTSLTTMRESFDEIDRIFVGEQRCDRCGAFMLYSRRANTPVEINMAKKKPGRIRASKVDRKLTRPDTKRRKVTHRVSTHKTNGSLPTSREVAPAEVPIGEAMRLAVEELGDITIDDHLAPAQLRELAECYEHVVEEQAAFNKKAEAAKIAKKSLESATNLLLEKVRAATHPVSLPLFDQQQAEQDREDMLAGGEEGAEA